MTIRDDDAEDDDLGHLLQRSRGLETPPSHVLHRAFGIWKPRPAASPGLLSRITAALRFDSALMPAAAALGVRSGALAPRQLLFSAHGRDVDLRVTRAAGHHDLRGQVLGPDQSGTVLLMRTSDRPAPAGDADPATDAGWQVWTSLDPLGEFSFEGISVGRYRMVLLLPDAEVDLPAFDIGGPAPP